MKSTIFTTPVISHITPFISNTILSLIGWKIKGRLPDVPKCVMIAAPHTSNWDYFYTLLIACSLRAKINAMGKKTLTEGFLGWFMKWIGIIPVDRSKSTNLVNQTIQKFNESKELIMIVPPSGTRNKVKYWKTGFYYIALGANVPISLGFIDYGTKTGGLGPLFYPTGDIEADMIEIRKFYAGIKGKYPEQQIS